MLNKAPIFLQCFSRGGSNIFWNMFLTHPNACSPIRETFDIFRAGLFHGRKEGYLVALLSRQPSLFNQWNLSGRRPISKCFQGFIDRTLHKWKMKTCNDAEMKYKYEDQTYSEEEVARCRLVTKNNNGLAFLSDVFLDMYPDATFFALIRHPVALYESHKRRGISSSVEEFFSFYKKIAIRMVEDEARIKNYHIVRFEDLLSEPINIMKKLYELADLDFDRIKKVRFKAKPHFQSDGKRSTMYAPARHYWFELSRISEILEPKINQYQIDRLSQAELDQLLHLAQANFKRFDYI